MALSRTVEREATLKRKRDTLGAEPPPGAEYPQSNASAEFRKIVLGMQCVAVAVYALPLAALALAARRALRGRRKGAKAD